MKKNEILTEMLQAAGVDPGKILGEEIEKSDDDVDQKVVDEMRASDWGPDVKVASIEYLRTQKSAIDKLVNGVDVYIRKATGKKAGPVLSKNLIAAFLTKD